MPSSVLELYAGALHWTFAHFSGGLSMPLTLGGWRAMCEATGLASYLCREKLAEIFDAATTDGDNNGRNQRPAMSFAQFVAALELTASAVVEKQWTIGYAAEKRSRFQYRYKDAEKSRVVTPAGKSLAQMLSAMCFDDPDVLYYRLGASPYAASTGLMIPKQEPPDRLRTIRPAPPILLPSQPPSSGLPVEPAQPSGRTSPRRRWVSSARTSHKSSNGRGATSALNGAHIYSSAVEAPRRPASAANVLQPQHTPATQSSMCGRPHAPPRGASAGASTRTSPVTSPRGRRYTEMALPISTFIPAPPERPPVPARHRVRLASAPTCGPTSSPAPLASPKSTKAGSGRAQSASARHTLQGAAVLYGGGGATGGASAGGSVRAVGGAGREQVWLRRAGDIGTTTDRDHDARLLREITTASTNYGGGMSPGQDEPASDGQMGFGGEGTEERVDTEGLQKVTAAGGRRQSEQSQALGSPRKQRPVRPHKQPVRSA